MKLLFLIGVVAFVIISKHSVAEIIPGGIKANASGSGLFKNVGVDQLSVNKYCAVSGDDSFFFSLIQGRWEDSVLSDLLSGSEWRFRRLGEPGRKFEFDVERVSIETNFQVGYQVNGRCLPEVLDYNRGGNTLLGVFGQRFVMFCEYISSQLLLRSALAAENEFSCRPPQQPRNSEQQAGEKGYRVAKELTPPTFIRTFGLFILLCLCMVGIEWSATLGDRFIDRGRLALGYIFRFFCLLCWCFLGSTCLFAGHILGTVG